MEVVSIAQKRLKAERLLDGEKAPCWRSWHTVRAGDLAPDHPDVGAADLTLGTVNESDLLAKVEAGGLGVVNALNLHQGGVGVGGVLGALVAQVASPAKKSVLIL
jgi:hypothetical protein